MKKQLTLKLNTAMRDAFLEIRAEPSEVARMILNALHKGSGVIHRKKMWNVNSRRRRK